MYKYFLYSFSIKFSLIKKYYFFNITMATIVIKLTPLFLNFFKPLQPYYQCRYIRKLLCYSLILVDIYVVQLLIIYCIISLYTVLLLCYISE